MFTHDTSHLDYFRLLRQAKHLDRTACRATVRIAVLADFASQQFVVLLRVLLAQAGVYADIYEAEYDTIELEVYNPESQLYAFAPEVTIIIQSINALRFKYYIDSEARETWANRVAERTANLWGAIAKRSTTYIVQSNFVSPYERQFGNFDCMVATSMPAQIAALNAAIEQCARGHAQVLINDIASIASYVGRRTWCDEKLWTLAKALCSLEHLPLVAQNSADIVLSTMGRGIKCIVLDLDNTLWGGVIGDDGLDGIAIGPFGEGEPFHRFQLYLLELKRRGLILCVCSKNEHETAIRAFREHPEMVLRESDIAVFMANWNPKVDNIKTIQQVLNIGLDSIVFLDDNPFERNMVRQYLPSVIVPELPEEPSDYVRTISELNLFETTSFTAEDVQRTQLYREDGARKALEQSFTNVSEYLKSLEMKITISAFDTFHLPRIAQLIQRSNQFNLTTRRYALAECEALMHSDRFIPLFAKLADKFGNYGLISLAVLEVDGARGELPLWLMSCRVLGRGVEEQLMNNVVAAAQARGVTTLVGKYIPTAKNKMVEQFYARFGFQSTEIADDGTAVWVLDIAHYQRSKTWLTDVVEDESVS